MVREEQPELCDEMEKLKLEIVEQGQLNELMIKYNLEDRIRQAQKQCPEIQKLRRLMRNGKAEEPYMCTSRSEDPNGYLE